MAGWTKEEDARLKTLAGQGLSASTIGEAMGRSRNAIIGRLLRAKGELGRLHGITRKQAASHAVEARPQAKRRPPQPFAPSRLPVAPPPIDDVPVPADPMTFLDAAMADRCLHFVGDWNSPSGPDMPVCGAPRALAPFETRYCRHHLARAPA